MITKSEIDQWKKDMTELSNASNVYCKFSGILTEVGSDYTKEQLDPYIDFTLNTFGSDKLMWGSDWPVLTMADNYSNWFDLAMNYCNSFSEEEKNNMEDFEKKLIDQKAQLNDNQNEPVLSSKEEATLDALFGLGANDKSNFYISS